MTFRAVCIYFKNTRSWHYDLIEDYRWFSEEPSNETGLNITRSFPPNQTWSIYFPNAAKSSYKSIKPYCYSVTMVFFNFIHLAYIGVKLELLSICFTLLHDSAFRSLVLVSRIRASQINGPYLRASKHCDYFMKHYILFFN